MYYQNGSEASVSAANPNEIYLFYISNYILMHHPLLNLTWLYVRAYCGLERIMQVAALKATAKDICTLSLPRVS